MKYDKIITYKGESKTADEWSAIVGLSPSTIYYRLRKGWKAKDVFETPLYVRKYSEEIEIKWRSFIDQGIESWHALMAVRLLNNKVYTLSEIRVNRYKKLKKDYEYFKQQDQMRIAV